MELVAVREPPNAYIFWEEARARFDRLANTVKSEVKMVRLNPVSSTAAVVVPKKPVTSSDNSANKRFSFTSLVVNTILTRANMLYTAKVDGFEIKKARFQGNLKVFMYRINVKRGDYVWNVYRRFLQFKQLASILKKKKLTTSATCCIVLPSSSNFEWPKPGEEMIRVNQLNEYISLLMSIDQVQNSQYMVLFLEPVGMGDSKKVVNSVDL